MTRRPDLPPIAEQLDSVVEFIRSYVAEKGYPPSYREIADGCGFRSVGYVHELLARLQRQGRITRVPGSPRTISIQEKEKSW